jgi:hypothetical protein
LTRGREQAADALSSLRSRAASVGEAGRAFEAFGRSAREVGREDWRGDALDQRLARARDLAGRVRGAETSAQRALTAAREAIPRDWRDRIESRIPGLGRADPYVREAARKLSVAVGTIDELSEKADKLRESAQAARELREADEANDDARRDRAVSRLRGRRDEEGG